MDRKQKIDALRLRLSQVPSESRWLKEILAEILTLLDGLEPVDRIATLRVTLERTERAARAVEELRDAAYEVTRWEKGTRLHNALCDYDQSLRALRVLAQDTAEDTDVTCPGCKVSLT